MTNYEKFFGSVDKAAQTISEMGTGCEFCDQPNPLKCCGGEVECKIHIYNWFKEESKDEN